MRFETDGLVLSVKDVGESDRVLTVLTRDYGVLRAFANGAKKLKSANQAATQPFCFSSFSIYQSRDSFVIDSAKTKETFFRLREDIEKLTLAQFLCEAAGELAPEMSEADSFLRLVLNCLYMLSTGKREPLFVKAVCEMRLLSLAGYMPALGECAHCEKEPTGSVKFNFAEGVIFCEGCPGQGATVSLGVLGALRHICTAPDEKLFSFRMPSESLKALDEAAEKYLLAQTGHRFKALDFYNSLLKM